MALPFASYINAIPTSTAANSNLSSGSGNLKNAPTNSSASNNSSPPLAADKVVLNFENADIQSVIKAISQLSGKNFVIDPRVKGTVNIVSDQPVSKADSYKC